MIYIYIYEIVISNCVFIINIMIITFTINIIINA